MQKPVLTNLLEEELQTYLETMVAYLSHLPAHMPSSLSFQKLFQPATVFSCADGVLQEQHTFQGSRLAVIDVLRPHWLVKKSFWREDLGYEYWATYDLFHPWKRQALPWERIRTRCQRTVLLGEAGSGKSWLLRAEGCRVAEEQLVSLRRRQTSAQELEQQDQRTDFVLPIYLHLRNLALLLQEEGSDVYEAIARALQDEYQLSPALTRWMRAWLQQSPCLLLLDALDTVDATRLAPLLQALCQLDRTTSGRLLVASRFDGYPGFPFERRYFDPREDPHPLEELELAGFGRAQTARFLGQWFAEAPEQGQVLQKLLDREPALRFQASLPQHLAFLCTVFSHDQQIPPTRYACYEALLSHLLAPLLLQDQQQPHEAVSLQVLLRVGELLAWQMATQQKSWRMVFSQADVHQAIQQTLPERSLSESSQHVLHLAHLLERSGIITRLPGSVTDAPLELQTSCFLSPAIACMLVARFLGHLPHHQRYELLASSASSDEHWNEVRALLAGAGDDPLRIFEASRNSSADTASTLFWQARCLIETGKPLDHHRLAGSIARALIDLACSSPSGREKRQAASLLIQLFGTQVKARLFHQLRAQDGTNSQRCAAIWALGSLGELEAVPDLLGLLQEQEPAQESEFAIPPLRVAAAWVLGQVGEGEAQVDNALLQVARAEHEHFAVRCAAIWSLGQRGTSQVLSLCREVLKQHTVRQRAHSERRYLTAAALWTIKELADDQAVEEVLRIFQLEERYSPLQRAAEQALVRIGDTVVPVLQEMVVQRNLGVQKRCAALDLLGLLLQERGQQAMSSSQSEQAFAGDASLGATLRAIVENSREKGEVRLTAAEALRRGGDPHLTETIMHVWQTQRIREQIQGGLAEVVGRIGAPALPTLLKVVQDEKRHMRSYLPALRAIIAFTDWRAAPTLLDIAQKKDDMHMGYCQTLAKMIKREMGMFCSPLRLDKGEEGNLRNATETVLMQILQDKSESVEVRKAASRALEELGATRAVELFLHILKDEQEPLALRKRIVCALWIGGAQVLEEVLQALQGGDTSPYDGLPIVALKQISAMRSEDVKRKLRELRADEVVIALLDSLDPHEAILEAGAISTLGHIGSEQAILKLLELLPLSLKEGSTTVLYTLERCRDQRVTAQLLSLLEEQHVHEDVVRVVGLRGDQEAAKPLLALLRDTSQERIPPEEPTRAVFAEKLRGHAAVALGQLGYAEAMDDLLAVLWCKDEGSDEEIRTTGAALGLWIMGFSLLLNTIESLLDEEEPVK